MLIRDGVLVWWLSKGCHRFCDESVGFVFKCADHQKCFLYVWCVFKTQAFMCFESHSFCKMSGKLLWKFPIINLDRIYLNVRKSLFCTGLFSDLSWWWHSSFRAVLSLNWPILISGNVLLLYSRLCTRAESTSTYPVGMLSHLVAKSSYGKKKIRAGQSYTDTTCGPTTQLLAIY